MKYVALLRGINVGGNNKVDMSRLVSALQLAGFESVSTYINSGNVFFSDATQSHSALTQKLEQVIEDEFGLKIKVLLRDQPNISAIAAELPDEWQNDKSQKCNVMFLWDEIADRSTLNKITIVPEIDHVKYVSGALIWRVDRANLGRSGMHRLVGSELYKNMTIRNCNTLRKINMLISTDL